MVALELAPNSEAAQIIIDCWKENDPALRAARKLQFWDNFLILCYSTWLALACVMMANWLYSADATANFHGKLFAWLMWVAGILDYVENHAINKMLDGRIEKPWPTVSSVSASLKFMIVATGVMYILSGILVRFTAPQKTT
jgi:small-conductance mechanosensitive channel